MKKIMISLLFIGFISIQGQTPIPGHDKPQAWQDCLDACGLANEEGYQSCESEHRNACQNVMNSAFDNSILGGWLGPAIGTATNPTPTPTPPGTPPPPPNGTATAGSIAGVIIAVIMTIQSAGDAVWDLEEIDAQLNRCNSNVVQNFQICMMNCDYLLND